jgi:hypothetical protein
MAAGRMTDRGWVQTTRIGDLEFSYRSGRDSPRDLSVFELSVGEITFENLGERPVNLKYSVTDTFFDGHTFRARRSARARLGATRGQSIHSPRMRSTSTARRARRACSAGRTTSTS